MRVWCLYEVGERQDVEIIKKGTEEEVIKYLNYKIWGRFIEYVFQV